MTIHEAAAAMLVRDEATEREIRAKLASVGLVCGIGEPS